MKKQLDLVRPTIDLEKEYLDFYHEWKESGENMVPWVISKNPSYFQAIVDFLQENEKGENLSEGWVPDSTYWLVNDKNKILGAVN